MLYNVNPTYAIDYELDHSLERKYFPVLKKKLSSTVLDTH
ncbi:unnamed protein product [Brassica oleracea]